MGTRSPATVPIALLAVLAACQAGTNVAGEDGQSPIAAENPAVAPPTPTAPQDTTMPPPGYNELANPSGHSAFTVGAFNTDLPDIENIPRPERSTIKDFKFSTEHFFGVWVEDPGPDVPHASFLIDGDHFMVVDYDGNGYMPYEVDGDRLVVYYNDFILRGRIVEANDSETLVIHWDDQEEPTTYYKWKN